MMDLMFKTNTIFRVRTAPRPTPAPSGQSKVYSLWGKDAQIREEPKSLAEMLSFSKKEKKTLVGFTFGFKDRMAMPRSIADKALDDFSS
jgi:hypothetical protein